MFTYYKQEVLIPMAGTQLKGCLTIPVGARGIIIFSQTGGYSRQSQESALLENTLQKKGYGTLVADLVGDEGSAPYGEGLDVDLLTERLIAVTEWIMKRDWLRRYRFGYLGAHSGAAAAINAAAALSGRIDAVVCRSGSLELAAGALRHVEAPVLLIVGALDKYIVSVNEEALEQLGGERELVILDGVSHRFEGGVMGKVAILVAGWFGGHLERVAAPAEGAGVLNFQK